MSAVLTQEFQRSCTACVACQLFLDLSHILFFLGDGTLCLGAVALECAHPLLGVVKRLVLGFALQQPFIERSHQHTRCLIVHIPQAHHHRLHPCHLQSALQSGYTICLYITHSRLASREHSQLSSVQVGEHDLACGEHTILVLRAGFARPADLCTAQQQTCSAHRVVGYLAVRADLYESCATGVRCHLLGFVAVDIESVRGYMQLRRRLTGHSVERIFRTLAACYGLRTRVQGRYVLHLFERCRQILE